MYSSAHAGIQLVVTGEGNHGLRETLLTQLKPGVNPLECRIFGQFTTSYNAAVVVRQDDHWFIA